MVTAAGSAPRTTSVVMRSCAPRLNSAAEAVSTFVTLAGRSASSEARSNTAAPLPIDVT